MVITRRRHKETMATSDTTVPLNDLREHDLGNGVDDGFGHDAVEPGIDDGLDVGTNGVPAFSPRSGGGDRQPSPGGGRRRGYFPVHNPGNPHTDPEYKSKVPLDVNLYATKKTVAQGMMDLALLTANANQLRYVLESGSMGGMYYNLNIALISSSIVFQIVIGIALIFLGRYNVTHETHARKADMLNNWIVLGVFLISVVNVFISAFGIEPLDGLNPVLVRQAVETMSEVNPRMIQ